MSVCCEGCALSGRVSLIRADHSSRGVLPSVVCLSVIMNPRKMRRPWPTGGMLRYGKRNPKAEMLLDQKILNGTNLEPIESSFYFCKKQKF
jgi:hypothetical protein